MSTAFGRVALPVAAVARFAVTDRPHGGGVSSVSDAEATAPDGSASLWPTEARVALWNNAPRFAVRRTCALGSFVMRRRPSRLPSRGVCVLVRSGRHARSRLASLAARSFAALSVRVLRHSSSTVPLAGLVGFPQPAAPFSAERCGVSLDVREPPVRSPAKGRLTNRSGGVERGRPPGPSWTKHAARRRRRLRPCGVGWATPQDTAATSGSEERCEAVRARTTGARLLVVPTVPDVCRGNSGRWKECYHLTSCGFALLRHANPPHPTRSARSVRVGAPRHRVPNGGV